MVIQQRKCHPHEHDPHENSREKTTGMGSMYLGRFLSGLPGVGDLGYVVGWVVQPGDPDWKQRDPYVYVCICGAVSLHSEGL